MSDPQLIALKISYKGEIHRVRVNLTQLSLNQLIESFENTYENIGEFSKGDYVIQYYDHEGDRVNISSTTEFKNALDEYTATGDFIKSLRFFAVTQMQANISEYSDPIIKAIEKLIQSLNQIMLDIKQKAENEKWNEKCQQKFESTKIAIQQAAKDTKESLIQCKNNLNEIKLDEVINDTKEGVKQFVSSAQKMTDDLVEKIRKKVDEQTSPVTEINEDIAVEATEVENTESSVVADEVSPRDDEWNVVSPAVEEQQEQVVEEEDTLWKHEVGYIREVFPECNKDQVIALLTQLEGNVQVVLNALAEQF